MAKLWQDGKQQESDLVNRYTAGGDAELDNRLVEMDVWTNAAHVRMLAACGYMSEQERDALLGALRTVLDEYYSGAFRVRPEDEDVHTRIENRVTELVGEPGEKIHTGRSRNDQVLSDLRLFMRRALFRVRAAALELGRAFVAFGQRYQDVAMPGYTHMQRAMPSSLALWAGAFAESLLDDARYAGAVLDCLDSSPLGSGAGYGVSLAIDREMTASLLGFSRVQVNAVYCHNARGKSEGAVLSVCSNIMLTLGRLASDLVLFTTAEYGFFRVEQRFCTGSSIMPQKRNLDIMELLRARVRSVLQAEALVKSIPPSLPSGYSRDLQETKRPLLETTDMVYDSLCLCRELLEGLIPDRERMAASLSPELYATDEVFRRVEGGMTFRSAYREVKTHLAELNQGARPVQLDAAAVPGTVANPGLGLLQAALEAVGEQAATQVAACEATLNALLDT